ncbi:MAG: hypothetical protein DHS20C15_07660 [Planctomycetota bacterium]|nr:MAG: hypothetical protein DHS20C15_07660 [Planctomycetota bacterium]
MLVVSVLFGGPLHAQTHKDTTLGFQIKPPKGYEGVAISPGDRISVAKFASDSREHGPDGWIIPTFDVSFFSKGMLRDDQSEEDFVDNLWSNLENQVGYGEIEVDDLKVGREKIVTKDFLPEDGRLSYFAAIYPMEDGYFQFVGTTIADRYKKARSLYTKSVRSFKRIEVEVDEDRDAERAQMSTQERFLQTQIEKLPNGWDYHRTERYLFLYNADKRFVEELGEQIEAIRDVYEEIWVPTEPIEAISIVRVCGSRDDYYSYGGRPGTGGYWNSRERELVVFDNPPRDFCRAVLNHEAFHQYIFYFYGQLSPASWYNEGTGDYFAGAKMTRTYRITKYDDAPGGIGRRETAKHACRLLQSGRTDDPNCATPLKDLLRYSQAEYYKRGGVHYAQGWAVVHFLREGKRLEPKWEAIYPDYLVNLVDARHEIAVEIMEEAIKDAEADEPGSSKDLSTDPEEWYGKASGSKTLEIQRLAYDKTFATWSDEDWEDFNEAYLKYVEKL